MRRLKRDPQRGDNVRTRGGGDGTWVGILSGIEWVAYAGPTAYVSMCVAFDASTARAGARSDMHVRAMSKIDKGWR